MTLYDQHPAEFDRIAAQGSPNISEMAKRVNSKHEMERGLGYTNSTVANWLNDVNRVARSTDRRAAEWLAQDDKIKNLEAKLAPKLALDAPDDENLYVADVPPAKLAKARKLLAMIGVELVEV